MRCMHVYAVSLGDFVAKNTDLYIHPLNHASRHTVFLPEPDGSRFEGRSLKEQREADIPDLRSIH